MAIGLGLMLLSLIQLKIAATPLESSPLFKSLLGGLAGDPFLGFFVAVALTWLMHSSLTMVLFVMALAAANVLPLTLAFALVLGANVGGAIAPLTALVGSPPAGRRVAIGQRNEGRNETPVANVAAHAAERRKDAIKRRTGKCECRAKRFYRQLIRAQTPELLDDSGTNGRLCIGVGKNSCVRRPVDLVARCALH